MNDAPTTDCDAEVAPEPIPGLVQIDPWLAPHTDAIRARIARVHNTIAALEPTGGLLGDISNGHNYYGFTRGMSHNESGVWYREWANAAQSLRLIGDFNRWNRDAHPLAKNAYGVWEIFLPDAVYGDSVAHGAKVKVHVIGADGVRRDRVPAYARRVIADPKTGDFSAQIWLPETVTGAYVWKNAIPANNFDANIDEYDVPAVHRRLSQSNTTFRQFIGDSRNPTQHSGSSSEYRKR